MRAATASALEALQRWPRPLSRWVLVLQQGSREKSACSGQQVIERFVDAQPNQFGAIELGPPSEVAMSAGAELVA